MRETPSATSRFSAAPAHGAEPELGRAVECRTPHPPVENALREALRAPREPVGRVGVPGRPEGRAGAPVDGRARASGAVGPANRPSTRRRSSAAGIVSVRKEAPRRPPTPAARAPEPSRGPTRPEQKPPRSSSSEPEPAYACATPAPRSVSSISRRTSGWKRKVT